MRLGSPQVPTRISFLQPSITSSSITIAAEGQPMPVACTETGFPSQVPRKPSIPRSEFVCTTSSMIGVGDVLRPQRIAGEEDCFCVVAGSA